MASMKRQNSAQNISILAANSSTTTISSESTEGIKATPQISDSSVKSKSLKTMSSTNEKSMPDRNFSGILDPSTAASYGGGECGEEENQLEYEELQKQRKELLTVSEINWKEPDIVSYCSDYEADTDDVVPSERPFKLSGESTDCLYITDDAKEIRNESHGYTLVEASEEDGFGSKIIRKFYPRIRQRIKSYKKLVPIKITYNKLSPDETGVVEEEDLVNEEMDVDEITDTILVKKKNEEGQEILKEVEVMQTRITDPSKRRRYLKLQMINDRGEVINEIIELTDDAKRTNDIMKAATPFMKRKLIREMSDLHQDYPEDEPETPLAHKVPSLAYADWVKNQNSQKTRTLNRAIRNLKQALDNQKMLKRMNKYLGKKLCEHYDLRGKKDPGFKYNAKIEDSEEEKAKYEDTLLEFNDVIDYIFAENKVRDKWITLSDENLHQDADELTEVRKKFYDLEEAMVKDLNLASCENQTHRSMTYQELINQQKIMDTNLSKVRFEYIRSQLILKELKGKEVQFQQSIDDLEQVDFINYEAMRAKTKDLNDKLDLKNKHVMTMKDTMTQRVQALAHVRLKIENLSIENNKLREEKQDIVQELKTLRKQNIKVQQERRKLEKQLDKIKKKEGLEKYPYLLKEAPTVAAKEEEQRDLLSELVNRCSDMESIIQKKLEEHRDEVEKYREIKEQRRQAKKLFSFDIK